MDERRRMQYLDAMGLDMYVPRFVLPAAKLPKRAQLPVATSPEPVSKQSSARENLLGEQRSSAPEIQHLERQSAVSAESATKVPQTHGSGAMVRGESVAEGILDAISPETVVKRVPAAEDKGVVVTPAPEPVQFSLGIWRGSNQLLAIESRQPQAALPTQGLLKNILLSKQLSLTSAKPEILNWPMFGGAGGEGGWEPASEMINAFLKARLEQQAAKVIWLLGKDAYGAVFGSVNHFQDDLGKCLALDQLPCLAVVLPSLTDMLTQPTLKAITWRAIRDLH